MWPTQLFESSLPRLALLVLALQFAASNGFADIEYSSLGQPGDTFAPSTNSVLGASLGNITIADVFTASFTGTLTSVDLAVGKGYSATILTVNLLECDETTSRPLPSTRIFLSYLQPPADVPTLLTINPSPQVSLIAGKTYALELRGWSPLAIGDWARAVDPSGNLSFYGNDGGNNYFTPPDTSGGHAFRVNATPTVPEPRLTLLLLIGSPVWIHALKRLR